MNDQEFLDGLSGNEDPFEALDKKETDTPSGSSPENNEEKAEPGEGEGQDKVPNTPEKDVPFHLNPRWQQREAELEELRAFREEAEAKFQALEERTAGQEEVEIPKWFSTLYGENADAWEAYQEHEHDRRETLKMEIIESQRTEQQQAMLEEKKWINWVEEGVDSLRAEGLSFDKNELLKAVIDYGFTDETGNYDFRKAYNFLEATKGTRTSPQTEAKKRIADRSSSGKAGETQKKDFLTQNDLKGKSWASL